VLKGLGVLVTLGCFGIDLLAHEIVGQVTPLMIHMKRALLLIENGKDKEAVHEIHRVYENFSHDMGMGMVMEGVGLKATASQIDQRFGTQLGASLDAALKKDDAQSLQKSIQELAFLLMLEKFDSLRSTIANGSVNLEAQKTMFWLGRNYFSYLLEPTLALKDPIEEQRLDRLLDRMLYRLEDGQVEEFASLRKELERGISTAFHINLPTLMRAGS
jgi:hypothetical protein